ncbi:MAG: hypothetical protein AB7E80_01760 [Hyphomicrobiaceae bacterium]
MGTRHFRLIFKRSQSETSPPTFSLLVAADMSPAFVTAARHYGRWNDIVYADPKLKEARDLRAAEDEARARQRKRAGSRLITMLDRPMIGSAWLTYEITRIIWLGPVKLAWWIWCAVRTQRSQILRLRELETGKVIAANTLTEIKAAEEDIIRSTGEIEAYLNEAAAYEGRAFEPERTRT